MAGGEDSPADTLVPRLADHGADLSRVHFTEGSGGGAAGRGCTPPDLPDLEREVRRRDAVRLVVLDPASAFLGDGRAARALLAPLQALAARHTAAVLLVAGLNGEPSAGAARAVAGPAALVAVARSAWLLTRDGGDPDRRLLAPVKNNLGQDRRDSGSPAI